MTQINELFPPILVPELLDGLKTLDEEEKKNGRNMAFVRELKRTRDLMYQEIVFALVPEKIHPFIQPFKYRFNADPTKPEPSDLFHVTIPGLPSFSFKFESNEIVYLLPTVNLDGIIENYVHHVRGNLSLVLGMLQKLSQRIDEIDKRISVEVNKESSYIPFEEDGPNADPEIDEDRDEEGRSNLELPETPMNSMELFIQAGTLVTSMADLKKLVREITIEIVGDQLANHIAYFHLK